MTNTCTLNEMIHRRDQGQTQDRFCRLSRLAAQFGIRAHVFVEPRLLREFSALSLGDDLSTAEAVFSVLAFRRPILVEGIMSVCLLRRGDGENVVAEVKITCRNEIGNEALFLRLGKVRQL